MSISESYLGEQKVATIAVILDFINQRFNN